MATKHQIKQDYTNILHRALNEDMEDHDQQHIIDYAVEKARTDPSVLKEILKKILPDLKNVDAKVTQDSPYRLIIDIPRPDSRPAKKTGPAAKKDKNAK